MSIKARSLGMSMEEYPYPTVAPQHTQLPAETFRSKSIATGFRSNLMTTTLSPLRLTTFRAAHPTQSPRRPLRSTSRSLWTSRNTKGTTRWIQILSTNTRRPRSRPTQLLFPLIPRSLLYPRLHRPCYQTRFPLIHIILSHHQYISCPVHLP